MTRVNPFFAAFNAGEFSPRMAGRVDFTKYASGAETLRNMIPLPQGGATRRPGTRHVAEVKDSSDLARLVRFQFNDEQAYPIEMGDQYLRFYRNQGRIVALDTDAAITNGTFTGNITGWTDQSGAGSSITHDAINDRLNLISNGTTDAHAEQSVTIGASFHSVEHVLKFRIFGAPGDKVKLRIGTTSTGTEVIDDQEFEVGFHCTEFTPTASIFVQFLHTTGKTLQVDDVSFIDNGPVEIGSPYAAADLRAIKRAQTADVMYLARRTYPAYKLGRLGNSSWSLTEVAWLDGPWLDKNEDAAKTLQASAVTGLGITITAAGHSPFVSTDVGRLIRIQHVANDPGYAVVTSFTSSTVVVADVKRDFNAATASSAWRLGAWSATSGYPQALGFFEQRLFMANTVTRPQTFWGSQSADFENMRPDSFPASLAVEDDDGLDYTIAADDVNPIIWLSSGKNLVIGTFGGEWIATSTGPVLTPNDIDVKQQTNFGSADIPPVRIGQVLLFMQKGGRKLRLWTFDFDVDGFEAFDITLFAEHITRTKVVEMGYQGEEDSTLWCVRTDGRLATLAYQLDQNVLAWGRSVMGGSFGSGIAQVESVAVVPGNTATGTEERDEIWVVVKRTINGTTKRYVEFFETPYENPLRDDYDTEVLWDAAILAAQKDAFYVDSGLSYSGTPITVVVNLDHLEGETVKVWADGAIKPDLVVSGGSVTLPDPASKIVIGLGYRHLYKSLKIDAGAKAGTAIGKTKRIHGNTYLLEGTAAGSLEAGPDQGNPETIPFREVTDAMDSAVPLFTGETFKEFDGDYDTDTRIVITGDAPGPFTLIGLAPEMKTNEQS